MSDYDFLDFIAFVLVEGPHASVSALDRALNSLRSIDAEPPTAWMQYTKERE